MIIVIQCKDQVGLVASISAILAKHKLNIISMREHVDKTENLFFMRLNIDDGDDEIRLGNVIKEVLPKDAIVQINPKPSKKVVVMVSKEYHCLADILIRNYFGTFGATVQCVIGNHDVLQEICRRFDMPFYYVSH